MVTKSQFVSAAKLAVQNVIKHGDTDIFPFPFENHAFYDNVDGVLDLIVSYNKKFEEYLTRFPPYNVSSLTPVSYTGFRWATQIDPMWNVYLLTCVLALGKKIEAARPSVEDNVVFSYRYKPNKAAGDLFDRNYGWYQFMTRSLDLAGEHKFVVVCDISEFYPRLGHHRLENALKQIAGETEYPARIMSFLSNFSNTNSFGLPIGGPAARLLSELTINQIDRLLLGRGVKFVRFADDYHIFCNAKEEAYKDLIFLSEKLFVNQGLTLQKAKTRVLTASEFKTTNPISMQLVDGDPEVQGADAAQAHNRNRLLNFSLRFDPYSQTAHDDYELLRAEIRKFDIIGLLKDEISKSRIHVALARKIVTAIRYLDEGPRDDAVLSLIENFDVLYPIFSSVLLVIHQVFPELSEKTKGEITNKLVSLIRSDSHVVRVDVHMSFALKVLSHSNTPDVQALLHQIYENRTSPLIRRDIILVMARWGEWYWLSDLKNRFRVLSGPERRAFILASYALRDEGRHWREHIQAELNPFEQFVLSWAGKKAGIQGWEIPL